MLLKPPPLAESVSIAGSRRYVVSADGLIHNVAERDLVQLRAAGCEPAEEPPAKPPPARVRMKGIPHRQYQPRAGARYAADAAGEFEAEEEDFKALLSQAAVHRRVDALVTAARSVQHVSDNHRAFTHHDRLVLVEIDCAGGIGMIGADVRHPVRVDSDGSRARRQFDEHIGLSNGG